MDAVIIGAGPAGLTAAFELLTRTSLRPVVLEASRQIGGLSQTVNCNGNRIDIGGHRFFSKSDRVMDWWLRFLPLQDGIDLATLSYQGQQRTLDGARARRGPDPDRDDQVMLVRPRSSRIYYLEKLFKYPVEPSLETLAKLGLWRSIAILLSYLKVAVFPPRDVKNLEEFFISRFGRKLYETFFKSYTEKVWGVPCTELGADWGAQRIKKLSISRALWHAMKKALPWTGGLNRSSVETSLIEQFLYPKYGPGHMWETVAAEVERRGGLIVKGAKASRIRLEDSRVADVEATLEDGSRRIFQGEFVFSTMPVRDLVQSMTPPPPQDIAVIADGLIYRDFVTVGLLLDSLKIGSVGDAGTVRDNWIYIHEPNVKAGRLQIFNNWSPWMVRDRGRVWIGIEYFCNEGDPLWSLPDSEMIALATEEMRRIGLMGDQGAEEAHVIRMPKAYPAYRGTFDRFPDLRRYLDSIDNLFLIGRNGMHRYNNQDHSMLAAMTAVDNIVAGKRDRSNLWEVNSEESYHEENKKK